MLPADTHIAADWLRLIRAEYLEIPGLQLTKPQAQRLWGLDPLTCAMLLSALLDVKFLKRTRQGAYVRADQG
jgi:ribonuclease D